VLSIDGVVYRPGFLQVTRGWATVGGAAERAISVTVDMDGGARMIIKIEGQDAFEVRPTGTVTIRGR
jgi:hypothetical protein